MPAAIDFLPAPHDITPREKDQASDLLTAMKPVIEKFFAGIKKDIVQQVMMIAGGSMFLKMAEELDANPWIALCSIEGALLPDPQQPPRLERA